MTYRLQHPSLGISFRRGKTKSDITQSVICQVGLACNRFDDNAFLRQNQSNKTIIKRGKVLRLVETKRGDILRVDFGKENGSLQGGIRPAVVLQNEQGNRYAPIIFVVPLTSRKKKHLPVHGLVSTNRATGIREDSTFLAEQGRPIDKTQILEKLGRVSDEVLVDIGYALAINQGLIPLTRETDINRQSAFHANQYTSLSQSIHANLGFV